MNTSKVVVVCYKSIRSLNILSSFHGVTNACDTSDSFLLKVTFAFESHFRKKTFRCGIHSCTSFYLRHSTFRNIL